MWTEAEGEEAEGDDDQAPQRVRAQLHPLPRLIPHDADRPVPLAQRDHFRFRDATFSS